MWTVFFNIHYTALSIWLANSQLGYMFIWKPFGGLSYHMSWDFSGKTKVNHKKLNLLELVFGLIFEPGTFQIQTYVLLYNTLLWVCVYMAACVSVGAWFTPMCHFNSLWAMPQLVFSASHVYWVYIFMLEHCLCLISQNGLFGCHWNQLTVWVTLNSTTRWRHILGYNGAWLVPVNYQSFFYFCCWDHHVLV